MTMPSYVQRVIVRAICDRGHHHPLCVPIQRGVHPSLRCDGSQPTGYGRGGSGCRLPDDLEAQVMRELRENMQECVRQGFVLVG